MATEDSPFLSRWSRRKSLAREGLPVADKVALPPAVPVPMRVEAQGATALPPALTPTPTPMPMPVPAALPAVEAPPALTLDDVALLTRESDFTGFVARGVTPEVKNAALKKLFTDPHFNIMDGLDTYIDDYNKPDPLPEGMLRQMVQSKLLGLFDDDPPAAQTATETTTQTATANDALPAPSALPPTDPLLPNPADEDADLQLQPDNAAGRPGPPPGAGEDAGRQH